MDAFDIDMSAPVDPPGFTSGISGPNVGGHIPPNWYIQFGMDIGAAEGTPVYAAFDGHVTKFQPHNPAADSDKVYGAQIFMRAPNDGMGGFYTHLTDTPDGLAPNSQVSRGDYLGTVYTHPGMTSHLHLALVEIVGGLPGGLYQGVNLYAFFLGLESSESGTVVPVTFAQDGSAPRPNGQ